MIPLFSMFLEMDDYKMQPSAIDLANQEKLKCIFQKEKSASKLEKLEAILEAQKRAIVIVED